MRTYVGFNASTYVKGFKKLNFYKKKLWALRDGPVHK